MYLLVIGLLFVSFGSSAISLYPNFNTIGITVTDSATSCGEVAYCQVSPEICGVSSIYKAPQRTNTHYGSLFNLKSDTEYSVSVTCGSNNYEETVTTRKDYTIPSTFSQTLYVSPTGSGTDCSSGSPCTLYEANNQLSAGTKVVLKSGIYHGVGNIEIWDHGTSSQPIVFEGEDGAILDGSSDDLTMSSEGGGVYSTDTGSYDSVRHVVMIKKSDGTIQRLLRYITDETDFENLVYTTHGYWLSGSTLKVNIGTDLDVDDYNFRHSVQNVMFYIYSDYVYFKNIEFRHYGYDDYAKAIYLYGASYGYITDCTFNHNDVSIGMKLDTDDILIENNVFSDSKYQFSWQGVKDNDVEQELGAITAFADGEYVENRGLVVRHNTFHDFFDGFGACQAPVGEEPELSNEIDIHDNYIYNCGDDGFECDGLASNVRIFNNRIENVLAGISLAPSVVGPTFVFNNRITTTGQGYRSGEEYYGMGFKINVNSGWTSGVIHIYHNLVNTNNAGSSAIVTWYGDWENYLLRNNIIIGDQYAMEIGYVDRPLDFDYNALYCQRADELVFWEGIGDLYPLSEVQSQVSQEMNGVELTTDSIFEGGDLFSLKSDSGCIGMGEYIPGLNRENEVNIGLLRDCDYFVLGENGCSDEDDDDDSEEDVGTIVMMFGKLFVLLIFCLF